LYRNRCKSREAQVEPAAAAAAGASAAVGAAAAVGAGVVKVTDRRRLQHHMRLFQCTRKVEVENNTLLLIRTCR
jgi:hypothetical protein